MLSEGRKKRFWFAAAAGLLLLAYLFKHADLRKLLVSLANIDMRWAAAAVLASALSYFCISAVLDRLLKGSGEKVRFASIFKICLLSCTLNYLMAVGGLSGVAAKVYLLSRENIQPSRTLSISVVHGFLTNTVAVVFIYFGFFVLLSRYQMNTRQIEVGVLILIVASLVTWVTIQIILQESFRRRLWGLGMRCALWVGRKFRHPNWIHSGKAEDFFNNFNASLNLLVKDIRQLAAPGVYAFMDWALMFFCLKSAFLAVNYPVDNMTLLVGFSIGIFTTLFSLTPASIGLMEGSMAGSFYLMGLDYNQALLGTLVFRLAYYVLPIVTSLFFYRRFFPSAAPFSAPEAKDSQRRPPGAP